MYKTAILVLVLAAVSSYLSLSGLVPFLAFSSLRSTILTAVSRSPIASIPAIPTSNEDMATAAARSVSRSVVNKVFAQEQAEGVGARVRRSIGSQGLRNLTPFLMLDHFHVGKGAGFDDHPHRGQATVTYLLEGAFQHEDSAGHKGRIDAGGVQWMCAGKGVLHAEMPVEEPGLPEPRGLQLWIDLPQEYKMVDPTYQDLAPSGVPSAYPEGEDGPVQVKVISGKAFGIESPVRPLGGCWYFHVIFKREASIFVDLPANWTSFAYITKGALRVGPNDGLASDAFNTLVLSAEEGETGVQLTATQPGTELVLVAGEPLDQPVVQYGPFVMTTMDEIRKTIIDYQTGVNGFETAKKWKSKIGMHAK